MNRPRASGGAANPASPWTASEATPVADAEIDAYVTKAFRPGALERVPALSAWLQRMEQYPQLSATAQNELVATYQDALAAQDELERRVHRGGAVRKARQRAQRAPQLLEYLIGANFRLVLVIARDQANKRYSSKAKVVEILGDLVAEGNVAIVEAARNYDPDRCPTFATYAARAIRDRIRSVLQSQSPLHISPSWARMYRIAQHEVADLTAQLGRRPSTEELQESLLAHCMKWAEDHLTDSQKNLPAEEKQQVMVAKLRKQGMLGAIENIEEVLAYSPTTASLDTPFSDDSSSTLSDMVFDEVDTNSVFAGVEHEELGTALRKALAMLTEREQRIIMLRHGFVDNTTWTYNQIAGEFGISAERVRQIERAVLKKLSSPHGQFSFLADHLDISGDED